MRKSGTFNNDFNDYNYYKHYNDYSDCNADYRASDLDLDLDGEGWLQ